MTDEEKNLLIIDLTARIPYNVRLRVNLQYGDNGHKEGLYDAELNTIDSLGFCDVTYYENGTWVRNWSFAIDEVKPYLRRISEMTEEELLDLENITGAKTYDNHISFPEYNYYTCEYDWAKVFNWLNKRHFDYRGLIDKGLTIEIKYETGI
jgi:hypothetical protein